MNIYKIIETITTTISTEYYIEAKNHKEALENFRHSGEYAGECISSPENEGIKIELFKKGASDERL